jgi:hypothetical protein
LYEQARKKRFQRMNERFFGILRTADPTTGLFRAHIRVQVRPQLRVARMTNPGAIG